MAVRGGLLSGYEGRPITATSGGGRPLTQNQATRLDLSTKIYSQVTGSESLSGNETVRACTAFFFSPEEELEENIGRGKGVGVGCREIEANCTVMEN